MTDAVDRASELENKFREQALAANKPIAEKPREFDGHRYCLGCDLGLSTQRLLALPNAVRCVDCQTDNEQQGKHL
jgi:DnaK suppressor protein